MRTKTKGNVITTSFGDGFIFVSHFSISRLGQFAFDFLCYVLFPRFL